jgi:cyclophilin family peptidyl-prolyl cis-trans isomerase
MAGRVTQTIPLPRLSRRYALTLLGSALVGGLVACQAAPPPTPTAPPPSPTSAPAAATTGGSTTVLQWKTPPAMTIDPSKSYSAVIKTTDGDMTADLFVKDAPVTVNNFVFLANQHFYDNVKFHRIIKGFMAQTGDPTGTGAGGPGYRFNDEPVSRKYLRGTLAMANAGPNTNGSQFFIMHQDYPLPPNYTIFGQVTAGLDVLDKIANTPVAPSPSGEMSVPTQDVRITSISIQQK